MSIWVPAYVCAGRAPSLIVSDSHIAQQAPLSMEFSRQEWSGLPCPSPGDLPNPGIKPRSPESPALAGGFSTSEPPGKLPIVPSYSIQMWVLLWITSTISWRQVKEIIIDHVGKPHRISWKALRAKQVSLRKKHSYLKTAHQLLPESFWPAGCPGGFRITSPTITETNSLR